MIGRHKYNHLKNLGIENLNDIQKQQLREFETDRGLNPEQKKSIGNYFQNLGKNKIKVPEYANANISQLYYWFTIFYKELFNVKFNKESNNGEAYKLAYTIICYLFKHPKFLDSPLINKDFNQVNINKGLLLVGGYGVGKTSIIKSVHQMIRKASNPIRYVQDENGKQQPIPRYKASFRFTTANDIVSEYESIKNTLDKNMFWNKYQNGTIYIDDLMTERDASNFGKVNIFKELLEKRSITQAKTLVSMNYVNDNFNETLQAYKEKYGPRNHDRLYQMFNIIELKGKSLRR